MLRFYCILFLLNASVFSSSNEMYLNALQERQPKILFDDCVNIVSGNFVFDDEIVVDGKEPIKLKRSYFSLSNFDPRPKSEKICDDYILAGWSYHNVIKAFFYGDRIDIVQPTDVIYSFQIPYTKERSKKKKKKKDKNDRVLDLQYKYTIYLPNFSYEKNERLTDPKDIKVQLKGDNLFVYYPDGVQKFYKKERNESNDYLLRSEILSNQNRIYYFYDELDRLVEIQSTNPQGNLVYAWIRFKYFQNSFKDKEKPKDKYDFVITTSDKKKYEFKHGSYYPLISSKIKSKHPFYILEDVFSNQCSEKFDYHLGYKKTHPLLKTIVQPDKKIKRINYYLLGDKNPEVAVQFFDTNDFRFERVKTLEEAIKRGSSFTTTYKFYYNPPNFSNKRGCTTVYDSSDNRYDYYYNEDSKIEKIQRFQNINGQYILQNKEIFVWQNIKNTPVLISKAFLDENSEVIFAKRYFYDNEVNLIEEKTYGNITGIGKKLCLNEKSLPIEGGDVFSKRYKYSQDNRNLLIEETDDDKMAVKYFYLPESNIVSSKIILFNKEIKKRHFYEYNNNNYLIKEIVDDGLSFDKNDISNITYRNIKYIYPKKDEPFYGFTNSMEEKYLDLKTKKEKLLKRETYTYSSFGKITKKDIYGSDNKLVYSLLYEFDIKGNLISKTDPLNRKIIYNYDDNNNKTVKVSFDGKITSFTYNLYNQLIKKEIKKNDEIFTLSYLYDTKKNKIAFIDPLENKTSYEYDNFSNLTSKITTKLVNGKETNIIQKYEYDGTGNKTMITQNKNVTKILYNIYSDPILIIYPDNAQESFIYNLNGTLKTFIDKEGVKTHYVYDFFKRIINKKIVSPKGDVLKEEIFNYNSFDLDSKKDGKVTYKYYYDYAKRLIKEERVSKKGIYEEKYFYDNLSRKYKTIYNNTYIEIVQRDLLNRITDIERSDLNGLVFYKKSFRFDELDNLSVVSYIDDKESVEKYYYDSFKRISKVIDALGNETNYNYDNSFPFLDIKLVKTTKINPINQIEEKLTDSDGKIILLEKKNASGNLFYKEENNYDGFDNLTKKKKTFIIQEKKEIKETFYTYDNLNRLIVISEKENDTKRTMKYTYTKKNYIKTILKPDNILLEKEYDYLGNLLRLRSSDGKCFYEFEYDEANLPIKITDLVNKSQIIRKYDDFGKLIEEKLSNDLEIKKEYDFLGRKTNIIYPDKSCIKYYYGSYYLQKVVRQDSLGQNIYHHNYLKYDFSGNMLKEELIGDLGITNYQMDLLGKYILRDSPFGLEKIEKYDPIGRVEKINWKIFWGTDDIIFRYNDFNRIIGQTDLFEPQENKKISNKVKYDENGNIIFLENEKKYYSYDPLNRLVKVEDEDSVVEFIYDGFNRKTTKNTYNKADKSISTIKFLYDELEEIGTFDEDNNPLEIKILGREENNKSKSIAYEIADEIYTPLYDVFGNVSFLISLNHGLVESYRYTPWGKNLVYSSRGKTKEYSAYSNPWRYLEKRIDDNINLLSFDTIFYNPEEEKLLNPNPINILLTDPLKNTSIFQLQGESSVIDEKKQKITYLEIVVDNPFSDYGIDIFSRKMPIYNQEDRKENLKFSLNALSVMTQEKITISQVLEVIRQPTEIHKIENEIFWLFYKNIKVLIDKTCA